MANWKYTLNIKNAWDKRQNDEISLQDLIKVIVDKLNTLKGQITDQEDRDDLEDIIDLFDDLLNIRELEGLTENDFDNVWNEFYDWADREIAPFGKYPTNKLCWVAID